MSDEGVTKRRASVSPWMDYGGSAGLSDCYDLVMRLALDGGLSLAEASDVCQVTLLRLSDLEPQFEHLGPSTAEWLFRVALEQCAVTRQLRLWRNPRTAGVLETLAPA